jgi:restriction system protein
MNETSPSNVSAAFDILTEEIEIEIEIVNKAGGRAFEAGDYACTQEALSRAGHLTGYREKVVSLRKEWESLFAQDLANDDEVTRSDRRNFGRLQRGARTPEESFYQPILRVIANAGGSARITDVLAEVGRIMKPVLKSVDYEPLPSDPNATRWSNTAQWARNSMVKEGLLRNDSPRGIWEITDEGRKALQQGSETT